MAATIMGSALISFHKGASTNFQILPDYEDSFDDSNLDGLLHQYRGVIINSLVTTFGLDGILFSDKDGGNVQTMHNAENRIYADSTFEERGERKYDRNDYATASYMNKRRKADFQETDTLIDGYTDKELSKDGTSHLEHIVSAKESHDNTDMRILLTKEQMSETINNDTNTLYTNASLNMSKNSSTMDEWANRTNRKDSTKTNAEFYDLNLEKAHEADAKARKYVTSEVATAKFKHYSKSMAKDSLKQGSLMAIRQALGIVFTEVAIIVVEETPELIKSMKEKFSMKVFFSRIGSIVKRAFKQVCEKKRDIMDSIKSGFTSGIFASLTETIINMFMTTAKNIIRLIRQSMVSITQAVKILFFEKEQLSPGERFIAASKVLLVGASTVLGTLIDQHLTETLTGMGIGAIPVIGSLLVDITSTFAGILLTGLLSVSFVYYIDHSTNIQELITLIDEIHENRFDTAIVNMDNAIFQIDSFISTLCEIDTDQLQRKVEELNNINTALKSGNAVAFYDYFSNNNISLQFHNSEEFMKFMLDEDTILEI